MDTLATPMPILQGTFDAISHEPVENPDYGYWVAQDEGFVFRLEEFLAYEIVEIKQFVEKLMDHRRSGLVYYGVWYDELTDYVYLDAVYFSVSLEYALAMAKSENQLAIWDVANNKEIRV